MYWVNNPLTNVLGCVWLVLGYHDLLKMKKLSSTFADFICFVKDHACAKILSFNVKIIVSFRIPNFSVLGDKSDI